MNVVEAVETTFDWYEDFNEVEYSISAIDIDTGCGSTTDWLDGSDHNTSLCKWESYNGVVSNDTNTLDSSTKGMEITYSGASVQGVSFIHWNICPNGQQCWIENDTRIIFDMDCTDFNEASADRKAEIGFIENIIGTEVVPYNFDFTLHWKQKSSEANHCRMQEIEASMCQNSYQRFNKTVGEILAADSNCELRNDNYITNFIVSLERDNTDTNFYDNLQLLNLHNGSNSLPQIDFKLNSTDCYNRSITGDTININLNVSATDEENDTIYYSLKAQQEDIYTIGTYDTTLTTSSCRIISFFGLFNIWEICREEEDFISYELPSHIYPTNYCEILRNDYTEFFVDTQLTKYGTNEKMLFYNPLCTKQKETILDVKQDIGYLASFSYTTDIYYLPVIGTEFNITFYNNFYPNKEVLKLIFEHNETHNLKISNVNKTGTELLLNIDTETLYVNDLIVITPRIEYSYENNLFNVSIESTNYLQNITNIEPSTNNKTITKYVGISIDDTSQLWQSNFMYGGHILDPIWSTSYNESVHIYSHGRIPITMYVTDSDHLNSNEFSWHTEYIRIDECKYSIDHSLINDQDEQDNFNILPFIKGFFGESMKNYLETIERYEQAKKILWFLFFAMIIGLIFTEYMIIHKIDFLFPTLISSVFTFIIAYLVDYTDIMLSMLIIIALMLAAPLAQSFFPTGHGSGAGGRRDE